MPNIKNMLLRFLQKGLTFHNIPLMLGITARDDENVVYSKQIGVEENNGKASAGPKAPLLGEGHQPVKSTRPLGSLCPGWGLGSGRDLGQT